MMKSRNAQNSYSELNEYMTGRLELRTTHNIKRINMK